MGGSQRKLQLVRRAERQAETRRRITEATVELHATVGPARTQISEIARRAGVQRLTVYNHFPDEHALIAACSAHWSHAHPRPDPAGWMDVEDAAGRTQAALMALYAFYAENRVMLGNLDRDAELLPALKQRLEALTPYYDRVRDGLLEAFDAPSPDLAPFLGMALSFATWRQLDAHGLSPHAAAEVMSRAATALQPAR